MNIINIIIIILILLFIIYLINKFVILIKKYKVNNNILKKINLKNLGSLKIVFKKERDGRNPKTKEKYKIKSRNTIQFKASETLKRKLN